MPITKDTLIVQFPSLSVRAVNVCRYAEIDTLGDLLALTDGDLMGLKRCGRKTVMELTALKERYADLLELDTLASEAKTERSKILELNPMLLTRQDRLRLMEKIEQMRQQDDMKENEIEEINSEIERIKNANAVFFMEDAYDDLPSSVHFCLQVCYMHRFEKLSQRCKNVFRFLTEFKAALPYLFEHKRVQMQNIAFCGEKSFREFSEFLETSKRHYVEYITLRNEKGCDIEQIKSVDHGLLKRSYLLHFAFLKDDEASSLADFVLEGNPLPRFFLLEKYLRNTNSARAMVTRDFHGINEDNQQKTLEEISAKNHLTRERARQITVEQVPYPKTLEPFAKSIRDSVQQDIVPSYSPFWQTLGAGKLTVRQIMGIVCSVSNEYKVQQLAQDKDFYLLKKKLLGNVFLFGTLTNMIRLTRLQRIKDERLSFERLILRKSYTVADCMKDQNALMIMFSDYFKGNDQVRFTDDGHVVIKANKLNVMAALEDILERHSEAMTLDELQERFNGEYGDKQFLDRQRLRSYLQRCKKVRPVGKSGRYVLATWQNVFTGSLTDCIVMHLNKSLRPMSLDEIYGAVSEIFPKTSKKSLFSLMGQKQQTFISFVDGTFGLAALRESYGGAQERVIAKQEKFGKRFEDFKAFVRKEKRMPTTYYSYSEAVLYRWMNNATRGLLRTTGDEVEQLRRFIDENSTLPRNKSELVFKRNCGEILRIFQEKHRPVERKENRELYMWYRKFSAPNAVFRGNCKRYFEELQREMGISLAENK